jgi:hypothetical protein
VHKTVESANFHAAILGRIVTIVRGDLAFSLPLAEIDELAEVLDILASEEDESEEHVVVYEEDLDTTFLVDELPQEAHAPESAADDEAGDKEPAVVEPEAVEAAEPAQDAEPVQAAAARPARRGRMWKAVRAYLENGDRAHGYNALLKLVKKDNLTEGDPDHALKILLGRKLNAGELSLTPAGRYKLVQQKDRQRGNVWASIQEFLGNSPGGASLDAILEAAEAGQWTKAKSTRTAVTRALKRYSDNLSSDEGLFKLA